MQELVGRTVVAIFDNPSTAFKSGYVRQEFRGIIAQVTGNMVYLKNVKRIEHSTDETNHEDLYINTFSVHFLRFEIVQ